ncbi:MAG: BrnT family toxin [Alphaproteobacteria bacterium]|nr:BrnT family toxin [Alphaproteobacteria bacterium]NDC56651.1 BrnT family toxin [Alphaproteobacteria bacterium]NDG04245.1 BrnT family toxin [Alphaproteobacteria bacterium]
MRCEWDDKKNMANWAKHGLSFQEADDFDWATAMLEVDERHDYGEQRQTALGYIRGRLMKLVFTHRDDTVRLISLRKANDRERAAYEKNQKA